MGYAKEPAPAGLAPQKTEQAQEHATENVAEHAPYNLHAT
jgi:hypothetical protein